MSEYGLVSARSDSAVVETFKAEEDANERVQEMAREAPEVSGDGYEVRPVEPVPDGLGFRDAETGEEYEDLTG